MLIKGKTILRDTLTFPIGTEDLRKEKMQESFAEYVHISYFRLKLYFSRKLALGKHCGPNGYR